MLAPGADELTPLATALLVDGFCLDKATPNLAKGKGKAGTQVQFGGAKVGGPVSAVGGKGGRVLVLVGRLGAAGIGRRYPISRAVKRSLIINVVAAFLLAVGIGNQVDGVDAAAREAVGLEARASGIRVGAIGVSRED